MEQSVQAVSLTCNHCGASLDVQPGTRFVTCAHCGSRLEVHRSGNAAYTEVLDAIQEHTERIAQDVGAIRRQNELEQLDREWGMKQAALMMHDKRGRPFVPTRGIALGGSIFVAIFGVIWTAIAFSMGGGLFGLFGVVFVAMALFMGYSTYRKAGDFEQAHRDYQRRREELLRDAGGGGPDGSGAPGGGADRGS